MIVKLYNPLSASLPKFNLNLLAVYPDVKRFKYVRRAYDIGDFELELPITENIRKISTGKIIIVGDEIKHTNIAGDNSKFNIQIPVLYITRVLQTDLSMQISGYDLKYLFSKRITLFPASEQDNGTYGHFVCTGTTFNCIKKLTEYNLVEPTDHQRTIYGMQTFHMPETQIGTELEGIVNDKYMTRLEPLSTAIFNLLNNCKTLFYEVRVQIDEDKNDPDAYLPRLESAEDKPTLIISDDKYNITSVGITSDNSSYKNALYAVAGAMNDSDALVKLVKRDNSAVDIYRNEIALDVDSQTVGEIDEYALKAAENYVAGDDFSFTAKFYNDEPVPSLAQKVIIKYKNYYCETRVTEITEEYTPEKKTVTYTTGSKNIKVLNVLQRQSTNNTLKIMTGKLDKTGGDNAKIKKIQFNSTGFTLTFDIKGESYINNYQVNENNSGKITKITNISSNEVIEVEYN